MYPWKHLPPPLTVQEFQVLFALARGDSYAYALKGQVEKDTLGSVKLADGTLYPLLVRLHDQGLIDLSEGEPDEAGAKLRRRYEISESGLIRLQEELTRLKHVVEIAESSGLLDRPVPDDIQKLVSDFRRQDH